MSVGAVVLSVLGLSPYVAEADTIITASKDAIDLILSAKELLASEAGQKFREKVTEIVSVTKEKPDGSVHIGAQETKHDPEATQQYAKGEYVWDSFRGWVWTPEA